MLWHAYVDESGDRGWKDRPPNLPAGKRVGSSRIFSATAVLIPDGSQNAALAAWDQTAVTVGKSPGAHIHFHDVNSTGQRKYLAQTVAQVPGIKIISVVLCKFHLPNVVAIKQPGHLYNWTLRLLIERLSWFGKRNSAQVAMTFGQVKGLPPAKLLGYLSHIQDGNLGGNIEWDYLKMPPKINTPKNRRMIQLADTASGSIFTAFEADPWGYTDQSYINMLRPVLWRPPGGKLQVYGLKYGPWVAGSSSPPAECVQEHPWLASFCG